MISDGYPDSAGVAWEEQFEDFYFQQAQLAVRNYEKVAAATRRVEKAQRGQFFMKPSQFGFWCFWRARTRAQTVQEKGTDDL